MNPSLPPDSQKQREELSSRAFSLLREVSDQKKQELEQLCTPLEPELAEALSIIFQQTPTGRQEAHRMEMDVLRRALKCEQTEQIFRPFGVLELVTPVRIGGETGFVIRSGPLLVESWSTRAAETLAKLSGVKAADHPEQLEQTPVYSPSHIQMISRLQEQMAHWVTASFEPGEAAVSSNPAMEPTSMDLLQPGFTDHLDVLFGMIQQATPPPRSLTATEAARIHTIAERGRNLTEQARKLRDHSLQDPEPHSVHSVISGWCDKLESQQPHLRIRTRLEAKHEQVVADPRQLHHLMYTLLCGITDGLPEGRALIGVSTRNEYREGKELLHVEIRDGGGLETFAGVGGELDRQLVSEQDQVADENAEWTALASRMNAEIRILRDADTVTRAEVFLPLSPEEDLSEHTTNPHVVWIIEDDEREAHHLLRMLKTLSVASVRFTSAAELKENFATASAAPDIVLLKYYLPDERGADVRSWLYEQDPTLPVILISSLDATHPGIATVNRLPSTLYLQKPFDAPDLLNMLHLNLD